MKQENHDGTVVVLFITSMFLVAITGIGVAALVVTGL